MSYFLLYTTLYYNTASPYTQSFHRKKYACIQGKTGTFKDIFHKKTMIRPVIPNHRFIRFSEL